MSNMVDLVVWFCYAKNTLGAGFKGFLFSPRTLGFHGIQFDEHIFGEGGEKPPTSTDCCSKWGSQHELILL